MVNLQILKSKGPLHMWLSWNFLFGVQIFGRAMGKLRALSSSWEAAAGERIEGGKWKKEILSNLSDLPPPLFVLIISFESLIL